MDYLKLLPVEVVEEIFSWLNPEDIISLSQTCRKFKSITLNDKLWTQVCCNMFGVDIPSANGFARKFYQNVLHPYGKYLGMWAKDVDGQFRDHYGCLIQISYAAGKLIGVELQPPKIPHLMQPMRPKTLFTISMDETNEDKAIINCCVNHLRPHLCELLSNEQNSFIIRCPESAVLGREHDIEGVRPTLEQYAIDHLDYDAGVLDTWMVIYMCLDLKVRVLLTNSSYGSHFSRLQYPAATKFPVPIKPGIFKGTDGISGIQFLMLSYEDENTVIGRKITGDSVVPAGRYSFKADLRYCLYIGDVESQSSRRLAEMKPIVSEVNWNELPKTQPFVTPQLDMSYPEGAFPDSPNECLARFHGVMGDTLYSEDLEHSPRRGHWVVFNENLFAFFEIRHYNSIWWNLYHRVQELQATNSRS